MTSKKITPVQKILQEIESATDVELVRLKAGVELEARRRGFKLTVGDIGERLVIEHFCITPGLHNLQMAPPGTKNVDALSRNGDRYSIKSIQNAKKTGTMYPDPEDKDKQLFEFLLIVMLDEQLQLNAIHQFSWNQFLEARAWDRRMSAWYIGLSHKNLNLGRTIL